MSGITTDWVENEWQTIYRIAITRKGVRIDWVENDPQTYLPHSLRLRSHVVCLPVVKAAHPLNRD